MTTRFEVGEPLALAARQWPDATVPTVTVICRVRQAVGSIGMAIEGVLAQRTRFRVEVLLHDEGSTDGTAQVVLGYQARHPGLVRAFVGPLRGGGVNPAVGEPLRALARGEFIAWCDGSDFWTDPDKLQRQVAVLRDTPRAAMCAHDAIGLDGRFRAAGELTVAASGRPRRTADGHPFLLIDRAEVIRGLRLPSSTLMVRTSGLPRFAVPPTGSIEGFLLPLAAQSGDLAYLPAALSVRRVMSTGVDGEASPDERLRRMEERLEVLRRIAPVHVPPACEALQRVSRQGGGRKRRAGSLRQRCRYAGTLALGLLLSLRALRAERLVVSALWGVQAGLLRLLLESMSFARGGPRH